VITKPENIDEYIAGFPEHTQKYYNKSGQQLRRLFQKQRKRSVMEYPVSTCRVVI